MYYATVAAAAALHQVLLRSLGDDKVVVQNVASGLFCVLFVALGVVDRPTLLAASMLGYLISDSTCVTTAGDTPSRRHRDAPPRESPRERRVRRPDCCTRRATARPRRSSFASRTPSNSGRASKVSPVVSQLTDRDVAAGVRWRGALLRFLRCAWPRASRTRQISDRA